MAQVSRNRGALSQSVYEHLIQPFVESVAPITHVSWGAAIGMFVGLTPTMGIQMYIVALLWVLCRYLLRVRFNLPIAVALVWISNPVTVVPIYYAFFVTGHAALGLGFDPGISEIDFQEFSRIFEQVGVDGAQSWFEHLYGGILVLFWIFGWPILVGSLVFAVPISIATYPITGFALMKYRTRLAAREGESYGEWKRRHVHPD